MLEAKYFIIAVEVEDSSERFELNRSFRPIVKFFGSKKAAEEWLAKKWGKCNLAPDEFSGRCLAAWKGKRGNGRKEVKVGLFEISNKGIFTMPKECVIYLE